MKEEEKRIKREMDDAGGSVTLHLRIPEFWYRQLVQLSKTTFRSAHGQAIAGLREMLDKAGFPDRPETGAAK